MEGATGLLPEGALRVEIDHLILELDTAIDLFELEQLVEAERGEAGALDAAEIAAAAFYPKDFAGNSVERVDLIDLGAGIPSHRSW